MNWRLGNITLYQVEADSTVLEPIRKKAGRNLRISLVANLVLLLLGITVLFQSNQVWLFKPLFVGMPIFWLLTCTGQLRRLANESGMRLIKTNHRFIRDCIGIYSLNEHVVDYDYRQMTQCTKSPSGLAIEMADGRVLNIPLKAFTHKTDFNNFASALAEQKSIPVIDLTEREAASAT